MLFNFFQATLSDWKQNNHTPQAAQSITTEIQIFLFLISSTYSSNHFHTGITIIFGLSSQKDLLCLL